MRRHAWSVTLAVALSGCGGDTGVVLSPVIETPAEGSDGSPWDGLTELVLSIAQSDDLDDLVSVRGPLDQPLRLAAVPFADDLILHLSGISVGFETAYGRTCTFEVAAGLAVPAPRLYFAQVRTWAASASPAVAARDGALAFATLDGRAIFLGGATGAGVERFDPDAGVFTAVELEPPLAEREGAALVPLGGVALVIGGVDPTTGDVVPLVERLDPRPDAATPLELIEGPGVVAHAAAALVDGDVLVVGGRSQAAPGAAFAVTGAAVLLGLGDDGTLQPARALEATPSLARADHSATRLGDEVGADVLLVGGQGEDGLPIGQAELYRPVRHVFELVDGAVLITPRWGHAAIRLPGGLVLVVGGFTDDAVGGAPPTRVDTVELYDPVQGRFTEAGRLPVRAGLTGFSATPLADGRVLLAGGIGLDGQPVDTALIAAIDTDTGVLTLSPTDRMDTLRAGHAAARLCDGTILVVGGASEIDAPGSERYNPPSAGRR